MGGACLTIWESRPDRPQTVGESSKGVGGQKQKPTPVNHSRGLRPRRFSVFTKPNALARTQISYS